MEKSTNNSRNVCILKNCLKTNLTVDKFKSRFEDSNWIRSNVLGDEIVQRMHSNQADKNGETHDLVDSSKISRPFSPRIENCTRRGLMNSHEKKFL